ncbi:MAG: DUF4339 domain-containing protein [Phycisphaera sp.]|nr:DUF4339 domain-containing protein [Phycisphaera sp.]
MKYIVRSVDGDEYGPFSRTELQQLVEEQRLGPGDFIRRESGKTWSPFEKIAGLATSSEPELQVDFEDPAPEVVAPRRPVVGAEVAGPITTDHGPRRPVDRPKIDDRIGNEEEEVEDEAGDEVAEISFESPTTPTFEAPSTTADPNPFRSFGLPISLEADEDVRFVVAQSFVDALRESPFNALLGHRAALICTSRRVAMIRPSALRSTMCIAWIDAAGMVAIENRRSVIRLVVGFIFLVYAASAFTGGMLSGLAAGATAASGVDGSLLTIASSAGIALGAITGLLGILAILSSGRTSLVLAGSGSELVFGCKAVGAWHLAQIDAVRLRVASDPGREESNAPPTRHDRP